MSGAEAVSGAPGTAGAAGMSGALAMAGAGGSAPVVELANHKTATCSSLQNTHGAGDAVDGNDMTRWIAATWSFPQWWRVDLGKTQPVSQVKVHFEHTDRLYTYVVETSLNDAVYVQQASRSAVGSIQTIDLPGGVPARYVRITITDTDPPNSTLMTYASFWEVYVYGH